MEKDIDDMLQNTHYHFQAFCTRKNGLLRHPTV